LYAKGRAWWESPLVNLQCADVSNIQNDLARVELALRELRKEQQGSNDAIARVRIAIATLDTKSDRLDELINALDARFDKLEARVDGRRKA